MEFSIYKSLEILKNTPNVLTSLLHNLSDDWTTNNEGENTWTTKEVLAHLIVCEETDWLPRVKIIHENGLEKKLISIDMTAHFEIAKCNSLKDLLFQFKQLRENGIVKLISYHIQESDLLKTAKHPVLGEVTLQQLIATWVTHDLTHIAQIARVIAKQNKENVGAFATFLTILKS